jgi:diguanylate cyclase (GGDEF)-like protein
LAIIDFDHFKHINDRWGHQVGDLALQHVATTLQRALHPGDSIGRVGGDEFVLLLRSRSLEAAAATCERLRDAVRASPFRVDPTSTMLISLSIGIATSERNETYEQLLGRADRALYDAKRDGRNRVCTAA